MTIAKDSSALLGKHDDGREGTVLTKLAQGALQKLPTAALPLTGQDGTLGTVTRSNTVGLNPDGSNVIYALSVNAGNQGWAYLEQQLWGRVVGVRYSRLNSANLTPFAVIVDGVVYKSPRPRPQSDTAMTNSPDYEALWIVADDLSDGPHNVRVLVTSDPAASGSITRSVSVLGWLVEAGKGHQQYPAYGQLIAPATVPTASAGITVGASANNGLIRKVHLYNSDTAAHAVTLMRGTAIFKIVSVPATATVEVDFGTLLQPTNINWKVDSGAFVSGMLQMEGASL